MSSEIKKLFPSMKLHSFSYICCDTYGLHSILTVDVAFCGENGMKFFIVICFWRIENVRRASINILTGIWSANNLIDQCMNMYAIYPVNIVWYDYIKWWLCTIPFIFREHGKTSGPYTDCTAIHFRIICWSLLHV